MLLATNDQRRPASCFMAAVAALAPAAAASSDGDDSNPLTGGDSWTLTERANNHRGRAALDEYFAKPLVTKLCAAC